jgi:hypothetical protein
VTFAGDQDPNLKGCVGTLIKAIVPELEKLHYTEFMQGSRSSRLRSCGRPLPRRR